MRSAVLGMMLLAACGSKKDKDTPPIAASGSAPAPASPSAAGSAVAAPAPPAAPSGTFAEHVAAAHKAEQAKDYATATTEFAAAAALKPEDAVTLAELTWVAYHAKQLDRAREVGARAVLAARAAQQPKIEAMALYNLGLAEASADNHAARSLYKASLDLRPNDAVRKTLEDAGEDGEATPDGDALLAKVGVTRIEQNRKAPEAPTDTKLLAALTDAGAYWDMGAGHGSIRLDIACAIADAKCTLAGGPDPIAPATGDKAKALIAALEATGMKPAGAKLTAHVDCYNQDEGMPDGLMPADSCDVTKAP